MFSLQAPKPIVVTCAQRISPYLEAEIRTLGYQRIEAFKTGVKMEGSLNDCIRLNMHLRCAGQVLWSLFRCQARDADALYQAVHAWPWEDIMDSDGYFSVTGFVRNERITNALFANLKVKDAIADRFRDRTGLRPDSGSRLNGLVVHIHWIDDQAEIFLDTSGETLMKHGYRKIPGKAPMMESLAAATIMASRWNPRKPFINPMCGSGTLAIEAALIATGRKPGLYRDQYAFMHIRGYLNHFYNKERALLEEAVKDDAMPEIIATDISEDAVNIARINARMAAVEEGISFRVCDFGETRVPEGGEGAVFFNPEYGDRLGEEIGLQPVYKRMGDFLKKQCGGYTGYIFTGNLELAKHIGLKPKRRIEFFNGKIDCRLLEYELYEGTQRKAPEDIRRA